MIPDSKLIEKVIQSKGLDKGGSKLARSCMVELCHLCDTQKRLTKLDYLFSVLTDGILIFDLELNLIDSNRLGSFIYTNYEQFTYQGSGYKLIDLPVIKSAFEQKADGDLLATVTATSKLGKEETYNISASVFYSETSEPAGICVVVNDATELQKQALQIEDMIASFTHDLKTPLIAAETNIKHLLDGLYDPISVKQKRILELMLESNLGALNLVKNLLSIFKYETQSYGLLIKDVKIGVLFQKSITLLEPLIREKSISIEFDDYDVIKSFRCDPFEIERVITNILSNAVKFSTPGSKIKIQVVHGDKSLLVSIKDNGVGISEQKTTGLFNRFWQSKQYLADSNGSGLGLYLSRKIIEAHGGKIWVESKERQGTTVSFQLPAKAENVKELVA